MTNNLDRYQPRLVHYKVFSLFLGLHGFDVNPRRGFGGPQEFEERTGRNPDPLLLKPEEFAKLLKPEDYNITPEVSFAIFKPYSGLVLSPRTPTPNWSLDFLLNSL